MRQKSQLCKLEMVYFYLGGFLISLQYQQTQYAAKTWVVHCPIISSLSMTVGVKDCSCCRPAVSASLLVTFHFQQFLKLGLSSLCGAWYHSGSAVLSSTRRVYGSLMSETKKCRKTILNQNHVNMFCIFIIVTQHLYIYIYIYC